MLLLSLVFLAGASAVLIAYVAKARLDGLAVFGIVLVSLMLVLLVTGASSRRRRRWSPPRIAVGFFGMLSVLYFPLLAFVAGVKYDSDAVYLLLYGLGPLLTAAAVCVTTLGRPGRGRPANDVGSRPRGLRPR